MKSFFKKSYLIESLTEEKQTFFAVKDGVSSYLIKGDIVEIKNIALDKFHYFVHFKHRSKKSYRIGEVIGYQHIEIDQGVGFYIGHNRYLYAPCSGRLIPYNKEFHQTLAAFEPSPVMSKQKFNNVSIQSPYNCYQILQWTIKVGDDIVENQCLAVARKIQWDFGKITTKDEFVFSPFAGRVKWICRQGIIPNFSTLLKMDVTSFTEKPLT